MSDLTLSSQQVLTQALNQLSKVAASSTIVRQAADVIVQHLAGNQLVLRNPTGDRQVALNTAMTHNTGLPGSNISQGGKYQAQLNTSSPSAPVLNLFTPSGSTQTLQTLGQLTSTQLASLIDLSNNKIRPAPHTAEVQIPAKVVNITGNSVSFEVNIRGKDQAVQLPIARAPSVLQVGQNVQLMLIPQGHKWQAAVSINGSATGTALSPPAVEPKSNQLLPVTSKTVLPLAQLLQADSGLPLNSEKPVVFQLPKASLAELISRNPTELAQQLSKLQLNNRPGQFVTITLTADGKAQIAIPLPQQVASINLKNQSVAELQQLSQLLSVSATKAQSADKSISAAPLSVQALVTGSPSSPDPAKPASPLQSLLETIMLRVTSSEGKPVTQQLNANELQQVRSHLIDLLRRITPHSISPTEGLAQLDKAFSETSLFREPATKAAIEQIIKQLAQSVPQGKEQDSQQIRQLLTQPALSITALQLIQPPAQQGLIGGLVALLQLSLAARLNRTQPALSERIHSVMSAISDSAIKPSPAQTARTLTDINQLEQRNQMIRLLSGLFSQHQSAKLTSAEQALQGQETLYYVLPSGSGDDRQDVELLIKRETEEKDKDNKPSGEQKVWNLTMKMCIGELGEMLTKARLAENSMDIDFYTSNNEVKDLVLNYLPLLKKRLASLGIEVAKTQCQLGKIPSQLQVRPYHIFETQA